MVQSLVSGQILGECTVYIILEKGTNLLLYFLKASTTPFAFQFAEIRLGLVILRKTMSLIVQCIQWWKSIRTVIAEEKDDQDGLCTHEASILELPWISDLMQSPSSILFPLYHIIQYVHLHFQIGLHRLYERPCSLSIDCPQGGYVPTE